MELLEDVVLDGAAQLLPVDALVLGVGQEERHDDDGRGVDGHRHGDLGQVDAVEELLHVVERIDRDAEPADFAEASADRRCRDPSASADRTRC